MTKSSGLFLLLILLPALTFAGTVCDTKRLELPAGGIQSLKVDCGAGALKLKSKADLDTVKVMAEIEVDGACDLEFRTAIEKLLMLTLEHQNHKARLRCHLAKSTIRGREVRINLSVEVPENLYVNIIDKTGTIAVNDFVGRLAIDDDSGEILIKNVIGKISVDDGSGDIEIEDANGQVDIRDGSGEIVVRSIAGDVSIIDASGGILVEDINGNVTVSDGSGPIEINHVIKNVFIREDSSGEVEIDGVQGKLTIRK